MRSRRVLCARLRGGCAGWWDHHLPQSAAPGGDPQPTAWLVEQQIYGESIRKINAEERPMASHVLALVHPKIARDPDEVWIRRVGHNGVDWRGRQAASPNLALPSRPRYRLLSPSKPASAPADDSASSQECRASAISVAELMGLPTTSLSRAACRPVVADQEWKGERRFDDGQVPAPAAGADHRRACAGSGCQPWRAPRPRVSADLATSQ